VAEELERRGWSVRLVELARGGYAERLAHSIRELPGTDLLVLAKIKLWPGEGLVLHRQAARLALDFDDAIYLRQPKRLGHRPSRDPIRRLRFHGTCAACDLVTAGNPRLAEVAGRRGRRVEVVPTTPPDDPVAEAALAGERPPATLVWIGLDRNLLYLEPLRPVLARLAARHPDLRLRIVSDVWPDWPEVPVERVAWSREAEGPALRGATLGLSPLADDPWTRGKCGFRLLQYMAAGLPAVASPVGTHLEAVVDGTTGLLARSPEEWEGAVERLLADPALRRRMGRAALDQQRRRFGRAAAVAAHVAHYEALFHRSAG
jgi:glycosyltransferase involved in cell wall biosynthesis